MSLLRFLAPVVAFSGLGVTVILLTFSSVARAQTAAELKVGAWEPYIDFSLPTRGPLTAQVSDVLSSADILATVKEASWKTVEQHLDSGSTASFGWIKNPERAARWHFSLPICSIRNVFVVRADDNRVWKSFADLRGRRVGWARGYSYGEVLDGMKAELQLIDVATDEVGLRRLLSGDMDMMPMDYLVARQLLTQKLLPREAAKLQIDMAPAHTITQTDVHLVCGKTSDSCRALIDRFDARLRQQRKAGPVSPCGSR